MIAIANEFVEMAQDRRHDPVYLEKHRVMLELQRKAIESAIPGETAEVYEGIMLGIECARVFLEDNPPAVMAKVSI